MCPKNPPVHGPFMLDRLKKTEVKGLNIEQALNGY